MQCTNALQHCYGKMNCPLLKAAVQHKLTAATCRHIFFLTRHNVQLCSDPAPMHFSAQSACPSAQGCFAKQANTNPVSRYSYASLLFIQMCDDPAPVHCSAVQGKMRVSLLSAQCKHGEFYEIVKLDTSFFFTASLLLHRCYGTAMPSLLRILRQV